MIARTSGIAYGFASVIALLVIGALLWIMFIPFVNGMGDQIEVYRADGSLTKQTLETYRLAQTMYEYGVPIFLLLIALYYAIDRALLKKKEEAYG